jgi:hypothetical protein
VLLRVLQDGFWNGWLNLLTPYTQHSGSYSAIADLHTLQLTVAHALRFSNLHWSHPGNGIIIVSLIFITVWQLRPCFCMCCWPLPAQSFSGPNPLGLATVFYCLRFETSLFVTSYDSQGHGGGVRPRLHTGFSLYVTEHLFITTSHGPHRKQPILLKRRCLAIDVLLLRALAPAGMCLPSRCLAVGIHVTILSSHWYTQVFLVVSLLQILVPKLCYGEEGTTFLKITGIHFRPQMVKSYLQLKYEI